MAFTRRYLQIKSARAFRMNLPLLSSFLPHNWLDLVVGLFSQVISFVDEFCLNHLVWPHSFLVLSRSSFGVLFILTASVICLSSAVSLYPVIFILCWGGGSPGSLTQCARDVCRHSTDSPSLTARAVVCCFAPYCPVRDVSPTYLHLHLLHCISILIRYSLSCNFPSLPYTLNTPLLCCTSVVRKDSISVWCSLGFSRIFPLSLFLV